MWMPTSHVCKLPMSKSSTSRRPVPMAGIWQCAIHSATKFVLPSTSTIDVAIDMPRGHRPWSSKAPGVFEEFGEFIDVNRAHAHENDRGIIVMRGSKEFIHVSGNQVFFLLHRCHPYDQYAIVSNPREHARLSTPCRTPAVGLLLIRTRQIAGDATHVVFCDHVEPVCIMTSPKFFRTIFRRMVGFGGVLSVAANSL